MTRSRRLGAVAWPLLAIGAGLAVLFVGLALAGYDPVLALSAMFRGAFGSWYAFTSATLLRSVPLILLGLAFALAFRGGALNIGGEGQFLAGAIATTWVGLHATHLPGPLPIGAALLAGSIAGVLWIAVPVWLKLRFGVLEVISTLLLNFVAEALVSLMVQGPMQERTGIYPQSDPLAASVRLPLLPGTRLHAGWFLALLLAGVLWLFWRRSRWGFQLKAVGLGPRAAALSGRIDVRWMQGSALLLSGGIAGLAGGVEVTGVSYALFQNLSPGYGFTAIAVALLARGSPGGVVAAGIFFGAIDAGAGAMQREAGIPAVAVAVVQAVTILVVLLAEALAARRKAASIRGEAAG